MNLHCIPVRLVLLVVCLHWDPSMQLTAKQNTIWILARRLLRPVTFPITELVSG